MTNQTERCDEVAPGVPDYPGPAAGGNGQLHAENYVGTGAAMAGFDPRPLLRAAAEGAMHEIRNDMPEPTRDFVNGHYEKAARLWGTAHIKRESDFIAIGPIGSRADTLLVWRTGGRVATGCFEGTVGAFRVQVESDYARRLEHCHPSEVERTLRHLREYRNAIAFIEGLGVATESKGY